MTSDSQKHREAPSDLLCASLSTISKQTLADPLYASLVTVVKSKV